MIGSPTGPRESPPTSRAGLLTQLEEIAKVRVAKLTDCPDSLTGRVGAKIILVRYTYFSNGSLRPAMGSPDLPETIVGPRTLGLRLRVMDLFLMVWSETGDDFQSLKYKPILL